MTVNLDINELLKRLKLSRLKLYPVMMYIIAAVVKRHEEFRMAVNEDGVLGIFDVVNPEYTVFHQERESFFSIWKNIAMSGLPLVVQVHHAICDRFHVARLINQCQEMIN